MKNDFENQPIAWTPTPDVIERAQLTRFMKQVGVSTWDELYAYSINDVGMFTAEVLRFLDIKFDPPYDKLLDTSNGIEFPVWFGRSEKRSADTLVRMDAASASRPQHEEVELAEQRDVADKSIGTSRRGWYYHGDLPHFDGNVNQFVTFRLADSLPQTVLEKIKLQLVHEKLETDSDEYRQIVEDYLDKDSGSCILRDQRVAAIVKEVIFHEAENSIDLKAWVIMPNHVHLLFRLRKGFDLAGLMKRIKGVSARRINKLLGQKGSVWQADYFDRYIRDGRHFGNTHHYIEENPVVSKLVAVPDDWEFSSAHTRREDPPVRMSAKQEKVTSISSKVGETTTTLAGGTDDADKSVLAPAGLNITEMCLDRWQTDEMQHRLALICEGENGWVTAFTYSDLQDSVARCAAGLRSLGLQKGDAIGMHLPMTPATVISLLAINRIGAIAVPVFSGYGIEAIASRMKAVAAKALVTCDGFHRRGKLFNALEISLQAAKECPSIKRVIVVNNLDEPLDSQVNLSELNLIDFDTICLNKPSVIDAGIEPTSAEDPLIILYTSGTTGKPKGIAHTHASFPIKAAQDMAFGTDVGKGTRISWYTDIGWMMGPWLIYGALINGATICIYDGAPDYPTDDRMWEFCAKHKVEVLGISPTLVRSLSRNADILVRVPTDDAPYLRHDLSALRIFASTGEPWNPTPWWWLFEKVGNSKLPIINYSGGTEISGGILMGNPLLPIKPCSFPASCPGMDVDIVDEEGNPVGPGKVGELVIKQPWIGMARGFWQEKERYLDTYWRRFKDIWVHGDFAMRDKDGHWFILGRSDDTLKIAGKRVGPAEVESLLVAHPLVTEAAVIGIPDEMKGTAMVAFCVLSEHSPQRRKDAEMRKKGSTPYEGGVADASSDGVVLILEEELKALVAKGMGKPLAPSRIHFVSALPKTRNAKVMRRVIRSAYLGLDPDDLSALENPSTVDELRKFAG